MQNLLQETICHGTPDFPIAFYNYTKCANSTLFTLHCHAETEFLFLAEGTATLIRNGKEQPLSAGDGIILPPHTLHTANTENGCRFLAIVFAPDFLGGTAERITTQYIRPLLESQLQVPQKISDGIWKNITECFRVQQEKPFGFELTVKGLILQIIAQWIRDAIPIRTESQSRYLPVSHAITFMEQHYERSISLRETAEFLHLHPSYLCRLFREFVHISPVEWLNRYRIARSCTLLKETDRTVTDIALSCGISNISYFNRLFLRYTGMTPRQYRNKT